MPSGRKPGTTALQPQESATLVRDDRAFDVRVVSTALGFWNEAGIGPRFDTATLSAHRARELFGWLGDVLRQRAELAGIPAANVRWTDYQVDDFALAFGRLLGMVVGPTVVRAENVARFPDLHLQIGRREKPAREWLDLALVSLPIYSRFIFDAGTIRRAEVPLITTVARAIAYSLAVVMEDRWRIREGIRLCPYRRKGAHFFLDYRTDEAGRFVAGSSMKYCCLAHSNAHRQQLWREAHKERT